MRLNFMAEKWFKSFLFLVLYFLSEKFAIKLHALVGYYPMDWFPSGIGLGILVVWGEAFWPALFAAGFLFSFTENFLFGPALVIGAAAAIEAVLAARFLKLLARTSKPKLTTVREAVVFIIPVMGISTLVGSAIAAYGLHLMGRISTENFYFTWTRWWFSEAMGDLIIGTAFICFMNDIRLRLKFYRTKEFAALFVVISAACIFIYTPLSEFNHTLFIRPYFLFPLMIWAVLRFDTLGIIAINLVVLVTMAIGGLKGLFPSGTGTVEDRMYMHQLLVMSLGMVGFLLAAATRERKEALDAKSKSEAQLQQISDSLPALVTYVNQMENHLFANEAFLKWSGLKREQVLSRTARETVGEVAYGVAEAHIKKALQGEHVRHDLDWESAAGLRRTFQIDYVPDISSEGVVNGYVMHGQDVTELRAAIKERDEFLSIASHELMTPLTSLRLQLQLAAKKIKADPSSAPSLEQIAKSYAVSLRQVDSLTELVKDLMDTTRIQTGKFSVVTSEMDLSELTREVLGRFTEELKAAKCSVEVDLDKKIIGNWDRRRLEQVVVNLLSNSIKYAPHSVVRLSTEQRGDKSRLVVEDSGPGIKLEDQTKIFRIFERVKSPQNVKGLGLGLFIVKKIVEAHHGTISIDSKIEKGTKFIVELPTYLRATGEMDEVTPAFLDTV